MCVAKEILNSLMKLNTLFLHESNFYKLYAKQVCIYYIFILNFQLPNYNAPGETKTRKQNLGL